MTPQEFQAAVARTACDQEAALARVCAFRPDGTPETKWLQAVHGAAGAQKELGEVFDLLEKRLWFGRWEEPHFPGETGPAAEADFLGRVADEVGDALYYVGKLCNALGLDLGAVMAGNAGKLAARYAAGWTAAESAAKADKAADRRRHVLGRWGGVLVGLAGGPTGRPPHGSHDWEGNDGTDRCRRCGTYSTLVSSLEPCPEPAAHPTNNHSAPGVGRWDDRVAPPGDRSGV